LRLSVVQVLVLHFLLLSVPFIQVAPRKCVKLSAHYFKCVQHTHTHTQADIDRMENKAILSNRCVNVSSQVEKLKPNG